MAAEPVTLAEALRTLADDALVRLFRARPDLVTPLPSDIVALAARATTRSSLARALDRLDRRELAVVEAVVVAAPQVSRAALRTLLDLPNEQLDATLARLRSLALVWGPDDALDVAAVVPDLLGPHPAGLGPPADDPRHADSAHLAALLDEAGAEARSVAERLAAGPPIGLVSDANRTVTVESARSPVEQLLARGLLVARDARSVTLPREVGLHRRGGRLLPAGELDPPALAGTARDQALVDRTAAGTTLDVVRLVEQLLDAWGAEPPTILRAGGVGVRDLRRTASGLDVDEPTAALVIETAFAAGLVAVGDDDGWLPTPAYDTWLALEPADRWARIAGAWLYSTRVPGLVGSRDDRDKLLPALAPDVERSVAPDVRQLVLQVLAEAPANTAPDAEAVAARAQWLRPRRMTAFVRQLLDWTLTEAAVLGVTGLGALAAHGAALRESEKAAAATLLPLLPEPVDHVLLQADLTAVAPGPLRPELARALASMADAESHGGATVYRFSAESVRRALDGGRTAAELHDLVSRHSATPVPQPLSYLIDDIARRHGHLRAGTATAYLRCDDPAALDALLADRRTTPLGLRRIAPTVVIGRQPVKVIVDELRALGYSPVAETPEGALVLTGTRAGRTAEAPARAGTTGPREPEPDVLMAAVRAVRAGDRARASRPAGAAVGQLRRTASAEAVEVLRAALAGGWSVWMGYVDQQGGARDRIVDPVRIDGGWLTAYDHAAGEARTFALHRITGAAPVD
ncbi:helicase-associated domain-containing protein [Actinopolymorpha sp. B17G11]|uniref:helicase-associated domain-containing protein n=1 Tax=Actinopolymorpha sp. B17G11 TaxID=3160861 RepID=UPI0032E4D1EC